MWRDLVPACTTLDELGWAIAMTLPTLDIALLMWYTYSMNITAPATRPQQLTGKTIQTKVPCGTLYLTINRDSDDNMFELFGRIGKAGSCERALMEGLHRMTSLALRLGAEPSEIIHHLEQIRCNEGGMPTKDMSCVDAIATLLKENS